MTVFAASEFPLLDDTETIQLVGEAVSAGRPFSLIRLGDGEGIVLSFGDEMWLQDLAYLHGHWGSEGVTLGAVAEVQHDLQAAVHGADIVGIRNDIVSVRVPDDLLDRPGSEIKEFVSSTFHIRREETDNLSPIGARRLALLHRAVSQVEWSEDQRFCSAWIHWELLASGTLNRILEEATEVGLVTARPEVEHMLARRFNVRTKAVIVPDKFVDATGPGRHIPDRYRSIRQELDFPDGSLVLVGAGIPGKAYCQWLKEAGCVAVDVGSVFDVWVGKASRPRVLESRFKVVDGDRVPPDLQLRPQVSSDGRGLIPRWKPSGVPD
jgi:hypothetical protein